MSKTSHLLEDNSITLARYCYLNDEDVQDIYELYSDLKESSHTDVPMIDDLKSWSKLPICQFTEKIFEYYNIFRAFFGSFDLNNIPPKTLLEFQSLISDPDNISLVQALVQTNFINIYSKDGIKVNDYISFLVTDIRFCFLLVLFQKQMSKSTLGVAHWKEIKNRRNIMIEYYNYIEKYKKPPKESAIQKLSRLIKREHNPYEYDYSCDINDWVSIEMELLDDCIVKYHHNISMPENPRISLLKRTGSTYTVERPFMKSSLMINNGSNNEKYVLTSITTPIERIDEDDNNEDNCRSNNTNTVNTTTSSIRKLPEYSPIQSNRKVSSSDCEEKDDDDEEEEEVNKNKYNNNRNRMSEMRINTTSYFNENGEEVFDNTYQYNCDNHIPLVKSNVARPSLSDLPTPFTSHIFFSKSNSSSPKSFALKTSMSQCQIACQKISLRSKEVNLPGQVYKV